MLDEFRDNLEEWTDERLKDIELLLEQAVDLTNQNGQRIANTIQEESESVSYNASEEFSTLWGNMEGTTNDILGTTSATTDGIRTDVEQLPTRDDWSTYLDTYLSSESSAIVSNLIGGNTTASAIKSTNDAMNSTLSTVSDVLSNNIKSKVEEIDSDIEKNSGSIISTASQGLANVSSNVVEQTRSVGEKIDTATQKLEEAIKQMPTSSSTTIYNNNSGNGGTVSTNPGTTPDDGPNNKTVKGYTIKGESGTYSSASDASNKRQQLAEAAGNKAVGKYDGQIIANERLENIRRKAIQDYYSSHPIVSTYRKGGLIPDEDNPLDIIAQSLGEDHMVAAKEGERILTPEQNEAFETLVDTLTNTSSSNGSKSINNLLDNINEISDVLYSNYDNINESISDAFDKTIEKLNEIHLDDMQSNNATQDMLSTIIDEGINLLSEKSDEFAEVSGTMVSSFKPLSSEEQARYSILDNLNVMNQNVECMKNYVSDMVGGMLNMVDKSSITSNEFGSTTTSIGDVNITLPNVTSKEEFVSWLKNDANIEKLLQSMTVGRMMGGNSYNKMRY